MASPPLIAVATITPCVLFVFNILLFSKVLDPAEFGTRLFAKLSAFVGLCVLESVVLLLPFDLAFNLSSGLGAWEGISLALFVHLVVLLPLQLLYIEGDQEEAAVAVAVASNDRFFSPAACASAFLQCCVIWACVGLAVGLSFHLGGSAYVPFRSIFLAPPSFMQGSPELGSGASPCSSGACADSPQTLVVAVTLTIYMGALLCFVGWACFAAWVGVGLIALPVKLVQAFVHRPRPLTRGRAEAARRALCQKARELLAVGESMEASLLTGVEGARSRAEARGARLAHKKDVAQLRLLVEAAEEDLERWQMADPVAWARVYNPLFPFAALLGGLIAAAFSAGWLLHICIAMLPSPPLHPWFGALLRQVEGYPLGATATLLALSVYLLLAALAGVATLGARLLFMPLHPLLAGKTLSNSLLFNIGCLELCALPLTQFLCAALPALVTGSGADALFGGAFRYLSWMRFFHKYNIFLFEVLAFALLALLWFLLCPPRRELAALTQRLAARKASERQVLSKRLERSGGALAELELPAVPRVV